MAKITIIHHSGIIGGAGVSLVNVIKTLAPHHQITVLVSDSPDDIFRILKELQKELNFDVESYGARIGALTYYSGGDSVFSPRYLYRGALIAKQWSYWDKKIKELNPEVVIVNSIILAWMGSIPEIRKRKSICFIRETINGNRSSIVNTIIAKLLNRFTKTVFLSDYDRQSWNYPKEKSEIIRDFISPGSLDNSIHRCTASDKLGLEEETFHVLYVGGVSNMKGFDLAVKAVLKLNEFLPTELVVAGVNFDDRRAMARGQLSKYEEEVKKIIEDSPYSSRIRMIGRQNDMSLCYAASDALVFPMRKPHQARPIFEAGYFSMPVVISDFPNIWENLKSGENGMLFKPGDVVSLLEALKVLAENPKMREMMGRQNREMTIENHLIQKANRALKDLIERV